jgi:hypothetical protein
MEHLCVYLLEKIFLLCPNDLSNLSKVNQLFLTVIENSNILKNVLRLGFNQELCEYAVDINDMKLLKYTVDNNVPLGMSCDHAAFNGNLNILKYIYPIKMNQKKLSQQTKDDILNYEYCICAIQYDRVKCLQYLTEQIDSNKIDVPRLIDETYRVKAFNCFKYLLNFINSDDNILITIIRDATVVFKNDFLKFWEDKYQLNSAIYECMTERINEMDFTCIEYLYSYNCYCDDEEILYLLLKKYKMEMLKIHFEKVQIIPEFTYQVAIEENDLKMLKFLIKNNVIPTEENIHQIYIVGDITTINFFVNYGYLPNSDDITNVIKRGNISIFQYLHQNDNSVIHKSKKLIFKYGNIIFIDYLHQNGIVLSKKHSLKFVKYNNLDGLRFLKNHNISYDENIMNYAIKKNNFRMIQYLYDSGFRWNENLVNKITNNRLLEFLVNRGFKSVREAHRAIKHDNSDILYKMVFNGLQITNDMNVKIIKENKLRCLRMILQCNKINSKNELLMLALEYNPSCIKMIKHYLK